MLNLILLAILFSFRLIKKGFKGNLLIKYLKERKKKTIQCTISNL